MESETPDRIPTIMASNKTQDKEDVNWYILSVLFVARKAEIYLISVSFIPNPSMSKKASELLISIQSPYWFVPSIARNNGVAASNATGKTITSSTLQNALRNEAFLRKEGRTWDIC
jgi:hypothetical protein